MFTFLLVDFDRKNLFWCSLCIQRCPLHCHSLCDWLPMFLFMFLQNKNETTIHVERKPLWRLFASLLLRSMCIVPRIPRAQKPRLWHVYWYFSFSPFFPFTFFALDFDHFEEKRKKNYTLLIWIFIDFFSLAYIYLGWHGNVEKQNRIAMTPVAPQGGMSR